MAWVQPLLRDFRIASASYCRTAVSGDWGIELPFEAGIRFHYVARGIVWLRAHGITNTKLAQGDVVLLPHGTSHLISARSASATRPVLEQPLTRVAADEFRIDIGSPNAHTLLQCCTVDFASPMARRVVTAMPPLVVLRGSKQSRTSLAALLAIMGNELEADPAGSDGVRARLADAAISMILRDWAIASPMRPKFLAPDADPGIIQVLLTIEAEHERAWSLPELAAIAGMSRTVFVERFAAWVGTSPGRYVLESRMATATHLLDQGRLTVAEIAAHLGYSSAAAFSRAFKEFAGSSPSSRRRR